MSLDRYQGFMTPAIIHESFWVFKSSQDRPELEEPGCVSFDWHKS